VLTAKEARQILDRITYKDQWSFVLQELTQDSWVLTVWFRAPDATSGKSEWFCGREWPISSAFTEDSLVGTVLLAIKTIEEHEMLEFFKVDGLALFNPHITVRARQESFCRSFPGTKNGLENSVKK
jgi:hypothetical protein